MNADMIAVIRKFIGSIQKEAALKADLQEKNEEIISQNEEIENKNQLLESKNNEITASITYAKYIQNALLPRDTELQRLLPEYFLINKPKDIVSGDFYWITEHDNAVILTVADCTGHGVPGAFMSVLGIAGLEEVT
jgi:serine phosphatase RsbU (regulator of sigma subunit)